MSLLPPPRRRDGGHRPAPPARRAAAPRAPRAREGARGRAARPRRAARRDVPPRRLPRRPARRARGERSSGSTRASPRSRSSCTRAAGSRAASAARRSCAARSFCPNCGRSLVRSRERRGVRGDGDRAGARSLMATAPAERERAIAAADSTCPRCGAARARRPALLPRVRARAAGRLAARLAAAAPPVARAGSAGTPATGSGSRSLTLARRGARRGRRDRDHASTAELAARRLHGADAPVTRRRADAQVPPATTPPRRSTRRRSRPLPSRRPAAPAAGAKRPDSHWPANRERLDDRARLVPEDQRPSRSALDDRDQGARRQGLHQVGILDSSALREPAARLLRRLHRHLRLDEPTPTPRVGDGPPGGLRRARTRARSPADRPRCSVALGAGKEPVGATARLPN